MSKDIRSYFQSKNTKPKLDEDEDVIPMSPDVSTKTKKKKSNKRQVIHDDSDEETKVTMKKKHNIDMVLKKADKSKPELKEVNIRDIFGSAPLKRTEPLFKKEKKKTEIGIHSDEEFEKSLIEIDNIEKVHTNDTNEIPVKEKSADDQSSNEKNSSEINKKDENKEKSHVLEYHIPSISQEFKTTSGRNKIDELKASNKRKFSEFTDLETKCDHEITSTKKKKPDIDSNSIPDKCDTKNHVNVTVDDKPNTKKKKNNKSLNESVLTDEERHERKVYSAALYQKYLNRSGPKHLGAKEIPVGSSDCLKDYAFLLTGVLESFEREEIIETINKYGGCIKNSVSKKVTHVLAGDDAGPAKMAKAQELGIPIINEDDFLNIIKTSNSKLEKDNIIKENDKNNKDKNVSKHGKLHNKSHETKDVKENKSSKYKDLQNKSHESTDAKEKKANDSVKDITESVTLKIQDKNKSSKEKNHASECSENKVKISGDHSSDDLKFLKSDSKHSSKSSISLNSINSENGDNTLVDNSSMWVERHKPHNVKQIIGQNGDASNVKKLTNWLTKWYTNRTAKLPKPSPWAKNDDGGFYKAALLSGPPGVGKTTTVALVCKELGFDVVEFNASDTRNKALIKEQIGELLSTKSLSGYAKGDTSKQAVSKKHVLVMDEVDGMAGNEDRGGLQELINLIKTTSVPIICMCNDRNSQKMRSLVNYCYDLRFNRPRLDQIKSAMLTICFKEGIKIPTDALTQLIVAANQDVRQTLNLLSMWAVNPDLIDSDRLNRDVKTVKKDIKLGPWEAVRKVFSAEDHKTMSLNDKSDLFFYDYSLAPLFVQENYLQVAPHCPKNEILKRVSKAADSISLGDLVDARIRRSQAWSLLPMQAMYSSVIPGHELSGHMTGQIQFPGWLGKNSRATKMHRLCQEIHAHTRLTTTGSKSSIFLDYCSYLRNAIINPLIEDKSDGISKSLTILQSYHLVREDLDSLVELSLWPNQRNPTILIDSKVKAAMTRTYNKTATALPYAPGAVKRARASSTDEMMEDEDNVLNESNDSDPENDGMIKVQKSKSSISSKSGNSAKSNSDNDKPGSSKLKPGKESREKKKVKETKKKICI